ncbi:MAG TPA: 50S ribosomal protein L11 methyltransferase [Melioribacteraceae bacterium]|nr:50S ribosomal protein L11 methyltransferase [Melioribacteraceae bacterium]
MKKYLQYKIVTTPVNNELISGMLWQFDFAGITETENSLNLFVDPNNPVTEEEISAVLESAKGEGFIYDYVITSDLIEDRNWNEEYEKNVKVVEVSDRIVIKPSFKEYNSGDDRLVITIDPKMSFGTGEHETTKLVLRLIEKYIRPDDYVLDVGSGTSVLAIAAVMLGGSKAIGIDNDEWCLLNGRENVNLNSLEDKVEIRLSELNQLEESNFDLIVANINKHILLEIAPLLAKKINPAGKLILSGLLQTDEAEVSDKYSLNRFKAIEQAQLGDWIALVFEKK